MQTKYNNIRPFLLMLLGVASSITSSGQLIKTYNGIYEDGTATYQYYENKELERVFHGAFTYKSKSNYGNGRGMNYVTIEGQFKDNRKHGRWTFKTYRPEDGNLTKGTTEIISGNFDSGLRAGVWTLTLSENASRKILQESSLTFIDNRPGGKFKYIDNRKFASAPSLIVTGQFDSAGFLHGSWSINYKLSVSGSVLGEADVPYDGKVEYTHGVMTFLIHRNLSSGDIVKKIDRKNGVGTLFQSWNDSTKTSFVNGKLFTLTKCDFENSVHREVEFDMNGMILPRIYEYHDPLNEKLIEVVLTTVNYWTNVAIGTSEPDLEIDCLFNVIQRGEERPTFVPFNFIIPVN